MNAVGYIRISMRDQSRYSLEYQERSIRDYCERNQVDLLALFKDDGESSYTFDRPDWKAVEAFIKLHKGNVHYLVVLDHDRFSRNLPEALLKIGQLETKFGIKVLATNEPLDIDTSDPSVFMQRAFKYLMANDELFRIRRRTSLGLRQAQQSGRFVNLAPFGYKNSKDERGKAIIIVDEKNASVVQKIFRDYLIGKSLKDIYDECRALGLTYTGNSAIRRVLSNCVYAGLIRIPPLKKEPERYVKALHQRIVSEFDYWRVQELLGNKPMPKANPHENVPLRGIVKCWCGSLMTAGRSKGRSKHYTYYRCRVHNGVNIKAEIIHSRFNELLETLRWSAEQVKYMVKSVKQKLSEYLGSNQKAAILKEKELVSVNEQIESLEERFINKEIESETYQRWYKKLTIQRANLSTQLLEARRDHGNRWVEVEHTIYWLAKLPNLFSLGDIRQKHALLQKWFKHGLIFSQGSFRTASLCSLFAHNELILKEKGLLFVEQPEENLGETPMCSGAGS